MNRLHPAVVKAARPFYAVGLPTPGAIERKREILMPSRPGGRLILVVADVVRCSSTLMACFGAGLRSATIGVKSGGGTSQDQAELISIALGAELVLGGELNGQPIPGGLIGNSPVQAARIAWPGKHLHFNSTNFGATFTRVHELSREIRRNGGQVDIFLGSLANCAAIVSRIIAQPHDRVCVATGGFYESASVEDMIFGGDVFAALGCEFEEMDDEARLMRFATQAAPDMASRLAHLHSNWIGRALDQFGMATDIDAIVAGRRIPGSVRRAMATVTPEVVSVLDEPVITTCPLILSTSHTVPVALCANQKHKGEYAHEA